MTEDQKTHERRRANAEAAAWHLRLRNGEADEMSLDYIDWLAASSDHEAAMERARAMWELFGEQATAPEVVKARRDALDRSGKTAALRWSALRAAPMRLKVVAAAALLLFTVVPGVLWLTHNGRESDQDAVAQQLYTTDIAETRVVTLEDNSRITLDASTRLNVLYTADARDIVLVEGQAHFDVAHDPARPFRVVAGDQTVVATGTAFNVEIVGDDVLVTLLEGEVVVTDASEAVRADAPDGVHAKPADRPAPVKLKPGEQLVAAAQSAPQVQGVANLEKTNAWRNGKVFLEGDSLSAAVARMNRYSRIKLSVADENLDALRISGVFDAGDTDAFIEAVEAYFPVEARRMTSSSIEFHPRS